MHVFFTFCHCEMHFTFKAASSKLRVLTGVARDRIRYAFLSVLIFLGCFIDVKLTHNKHHIFNMYNLMSFDICIRPCKINTIKVMNIFITHKGFLVPFYKSSLWPLLIAPIHCLPELVCHYRVHINLSLGIGL